MQCWGEEYCDSCQKYRGKTGLARHICIRPSAPGITISDPPVKMELGRARRFSEFHRFPVPSGKVDMSGLGLWMETKIGPGRVPRSPEFRPRMCLVPGCPVGGRRSFHLLHWLHCSLLVLKGIYNWNMCLFFQGTCVKNRSCTGV